MGGAVIEEYYPLIDGGMTDWTARLISNRKERLLISGIGTEFACKRYRAAWSRVCATISAISSPMASDDVAARLGALTTCSSPGPSTNEKSSTSVP